MAIEKKLINFRADEEVQANLRELGERWGLNQTEVILRAIAEAARGGSVVPVAKQETRQDDRLQVIFERTNRIEIMLEELTERPSAI